MSIQWYCKDWEELTPNELYEVLALRIRVFVVEQNCPYIETDGKDKKSLHLFALDESGQCVACARLVRPGVSYDEWSIGRVATDESVRRHGVGIELMEKALAFFKDQGNPLVRISAQCYLEKFYMKFGFEPIGEPYPEDNIPHIEMLRK
jgi:ElaA protein